eukprot:7192439-Prymnesium_polylepis.2
MPQRLSGQNRGRERCNDSAGRTAGETMHVQPWSLSGSISRAFGLRLHARDLWLDLSHALGLRFDPAARVRPRSGSTSRGSWRPTPIRIAPTRAGGSCRRPRARRDGRRPRAACQAPAPPR